MDILKELEWRGLLYQTTNLDELKAELAKGPVTYYCGFDPSADSLQLGNLAAIVTMMRFQRAGHKPLVLVGGATGLIGDPKANQERVLNPKDVVQAWTLKIKDQLAGFLDFSGEQAAKAVNNADWVSSLPVTDFLRDIGKHFSINVMLQREFVKARLDSNGISYTEFSYMLIQAYDFLHLYRTMGCRLQIGGADQWGNIAAGAELIRKVEGQPAHALTIPLVLKADGTKMGKTETGTIWLDPKRTSPYQFYQYWVNVEDVMAGSYLRTFTFLGQEQIEALEKTAKDQPEKREAQAALAREVTTLVHGQEAYASALRISQALFYGEILALSLKEIEEGFEGVSSVELSGEVGLVEALAASKFALSKRQAREDIGNGAVTVNGAKVKDAAYVLKAADRLHGKYTILRRGKKDYIMVRWK